MDIPVNIQYLILCIGILNTLIGTIIGIKALIPPKKGRQKKLAIKDFKNTIIFILIGFVMILFFNLINPKCKFPEVVIISHYDNELINEKIDIEGKAPCVPPDKRIALLVHWVKQEDVLERWFIHTECAALEGNNYWKLSGIEVGTQSMKGKKFEIFAYAVNDSLCDFIHRITNNTTYHGTTHKPTEIDGVFDKKTVKRK